MAFINFQPKDYFNTKLFTGTGSSNSVTGVGFQPDWCWIKNASSGSNYSHQLYDAIRGVTKRIFSDLTTAEETDAQALTAFGTDGFSVGTNVGVNSNGSTIASWNWKANGAGSSNTNGSITSTVSASTTSGFSILKYTGNGVDNSSIGHGLNSAPEMIILKGYSGAEDWMVYHKGLTAGYEIRLNSNGAESDDGSNATWGDNHPNNINSSTFEVGYAGDSNGSGTDYIAYCFHSVKGFSKFGSYVGNGSTDGSFIYTGFKPAFIIAKKYGATGDWILWDNKRDGYNETLKRVYPNLSTAEESSTAYGVDILSNGFKLRGTGANLWNGGNDTYIYMAFSEEPLVSSNGVPATAR